MPFLSAERARLVRNTGTARLAVSLRAAIEAASGRSGAARTALAVKSAVRGSVGGDPSAAEADWQYRISGKGVVMFHDFRSESEVDAFRWCNGYSSGNDPLDAGTTRLQNTVRHITSDGITGGGCLELFRPTGTSESKSWWRPLAPLEAPGNGKAEDDPGASGTIAVKPWAPTDGGNQTSTFSGGNYGPASTGVWDGSTFYLQFAEKLDPRRATAGEGGTVGKITYISRTNRSLTAQELVQSYANDDTFRIYKAGGQFIDSNIFAEPPHIFDEWVHYLWQIGPGDENEPETRIVVKRIQEGEKEYTKIFDAVAEDIDYQDIDPKAWNALICAIYHNGFNINTDFWHRYDQIIHSKEWIPPPASFHTSVLKDAADALGPGDWVEDPITWNPLNSTFDISWQNRTAYWDDEHREIHYMAKAQGGGAARHFIYDEETDTWRATSLDVADDKLGHIWITAFDHTDDPGDYYYLEQDPGTFSGPENTTRTVRHMDRSVEAGQGTTNSPWSLLDDATFQVWNTSDTPATGIGYHPNLMGPGRPGLFCYDVIGFAWWDKLNNTWTEGANFSLGNVYGDRNGSVSLYVPGHDILLFGSGKRDGQNWTQQGIVIPAGYGANPDATPDLVNLPISVETGLAEDAAHMLIDPRDSRVIMLLERGNLSRVWTSDDAGANWTLESFTHPFWDNLPVDTDDAGSWTPCSIPRYGVILGMASNVGSGGTMMWRPG